MVQHRPKKHVFNAKVQSTGLSLLTSFSMSPIRSTSSKQSASRSSFMINSSSSMTLLLPFSDSSSFTAGSDGTGSSSLSDAFSGSFVALEGVTGFPALPLPVLISNKYSSGS